MASVRVGEAEAIEAAKSRLSGKAKPPRFAPAGQSTQMIVGADAARDDDILKTATNLYSGYQLRRVYYSAYSPIPDASSDLPPVRPPLMREHRLRSEEHTSELQSLMRISYAVFCLKKKKINTN